MRHGRVLYRIDVIDNGSAVSSLVQRGHVRVLDVGVGRRVVVGGTGHLSGVVELVESVARARELVVERVL